MCRKDIREARKVGQVWYFQILFATIVMSFSLAFSSPKEDADSTVKIVEVHESIVEPINQPISDPQDEPVCSPMESCPAE
jgi:hypothetical protein